jgi:hypothetical protein
VRLALELGKKEAADSPERIHSRANDNQVDFFDQFDLKRLARTNRTLPRDMFAWAATFGASRRQQNDLGCWLLVVYSQACECFPG